MKFKISLSMLGVIFLLSACEGLFDDIYDSPSDEKKKQTVEGQLYVDASSWTVWHYIDLQAVADSILADSTYNTSAAFQSYDIPTTLSGTNDGQSGIYTYWYDVFGAGISHREFRSYTPTDPQPEPSSWTFAVHRNNVKVNGVGVFETTYTTIDSIPSDTSAFSGLTFTADEWNEEDVWTVNSQMLSGLIGNQGIKVSNVLSSWLKVEIPPMPPSFVLNNHVFIIKLHDGTYAAVQLADYQSTAGVKCCLTINYKYPI